MEFQFPNGLDISKAQDLVPEGWGLMVGEIGDIVFLGKTTIEKMISSWNNTAYNVGEKIKKFSSPPKKKNDDEIKAIVNNYNGILTEPIKNIEFKLNNRLNLECLLQDDNALGYIYDVKKTLMGAKEGLNGVIQTIEKKFDLLSSLDEYPRFVQKHNLLIKKEEQTKKVIEFLSSLLKHTEKKPAIPGHRPESWFRVGGKVVYYIGRIRFSGEGAKTGLKVVDDFVTAEILECDYFYCGMGRISIKYDKIIHSKGKGNEGSFYPDCPEVINEWEFKYLLKNPDFAKVWVESTKSFKDFNAEHFIKALETYKS